MKIQVSHISREAGVTECDICEKGLEEGVEIYSEFGFTVQMHKKCAEGVQLAMNIAVGSNQDIELTIHEKKEND